MGCCCEEPVPPTHSFFEEYGRLRTRKAVEFWKSISRINDHPNRSLEDSSFKSCADYRGLAKNISEGNNISNWARGLPCDILMKNLSFFCPCPENFPKAELKRNGMSSSAGEISQQHNVESVAWLLLIICLQVCSEKEQVKQKEIQMYNL